VDFPIGFPWGFGGPALVAPSDVETPDDGLTMALRADVFGDGAELLLGQFRDLPRFGAVLAGLLAAVQDAEYALWQLYTERAIDTGVGRQLDQVGTVVVLPRGGQRDETYGAFLRAWILALRSDGTWPALVRVLQAIGIELSSVRYVEAGDPASFVARLTDGLVEHVAGPEIFRVLERARLGGVRLLLEYPGEGHDASDSLTYGSTPTGAASALGYGSVNDADDGGFYGGAAASSEGI